MLNVKVFPDFEAPPAASKEDRLLLEAIKGVRKAAGAAFVNMSVFDYSRPTPDAIHYLTYPMAWIARYVRNQYPGFDPFQIVDFRRISHVDWRDLYAEGVAAEIFQSFVDSGLGRNGLSITIHAEPEVYCVTSLVFRTSDDFWQIQKTNGMTLYRFEANRLAECWRELMRPRKRPALRLTNRELEALKLAALGKTDDQIAAQLGIGKWTVVGHLQSAKYKLGCPNRTSAVAHAITSGLIVLKNTGWTSESRIKQSPISR